jgi:hypothetical protein
MEKGEMVMNKYVIFAFRGNPMCFVHVLLNALDMDSKGMDAKIVIEGEAVALLKEMEESNNPLYKKAKEKKLIDAICKGCSAKMGVLEYNSTTGIPLVGDMSGHPSMSSYIEKGYQILTL